MMRLPPGTPVWLAGGVTDMRKGFDGLAMLVQENLPAHVKYTTRSRYGTLTFVSHADI
jgi:IS66 Orf2 like protein